MADRRLHQYPIAAADQPRHRQTLQTNEPIALSTSIDSGSLKHVTTTFLSTNPARINHRRGTL
jgi:hypothetical protein